MNIGEMQRKLSLKAEKSPEHKFDDLYSLLCNQQWLRLAHDYVAENSGSVTAGCDGINMKRFDENLEDNLQQLAQELKSQTFEPFPVRRAYIPKPDGGDRPLGIPSIKDRIVQEALRMVLEPIYEADFNQLSFGFRPNRCTMDAVNYVTFNATGRNRYFWVVEADISSYFDTINHRKLIKLLRRRIKDGKLLRLLWKFLRAGIMEGKLLRDTKRGTPQGGIISPLLANIYLHELDQYMSRYCELSYNQRQKRRRAGLANFFHIRYADDFVVICNGTKAQAEAMKEEIQTFLNEKLKLKLSDEKTKVTHVNDGFKFLGFHVKRGRGRGGSMRIRKLIPKEAVAEVKNKIKAATEAHTHQDAVNAKILALNRIIGGWCRYYQYTSKASTQFMKIEYYAFWRMVHWLGRKYQLSAREVIKLYRKNNSLATENYRLLKATEIKTKVYRKSVRKPNPYTTQDVKILREELSVERSWTGNERRPGMDDLRPLVMKRDKHVCQMCDNAVTRHTAQIDHIKPVRRFRRPVDANRLENLWTLCIACHQEKTESDRQMESRMR
jgi:group II intron reverse transcriptase/maturase